MNEIEEKFYKTFEIKSEQHCTKEGSTCAYFECSKCDYYNYVYPPITDRILLELICIYNNYANIKGGYPMMVLGLNRNAIKESLLARFINYEEELKHQVQSLFTEGEE